jgi:pimeloyl-ACP methyl ester carboxylesterase
MTKAPKNISSDLQGTTKLTVDAIKGVTNIVESLHSTIASFTGIVGDPKKNAKGISGMVYRNIRKITDAFGDGLDVMLGKLSQTIGEKQSFGSREAIIAVTNGVIGDYLYKHDNPLAIQMSLRQKGKVLSRVEIAALIKQSKGKILILIHGLCMNDLQWQRKEHNHGKVLGDDLGYTTLYLHYNTGKHISVNGKELALMLEQISQPNVTLDILAHSMGGLLIRSACYYAEKTKQKWLKQCKKIIFLGTPHHGALLEKGSNWLNLMLKVSPYTEPFTKITNIRSSGITDLRHGNIIDEDWNKSDRFEHNKDQRTHVPLLKDIKYYAIASTVSEKRGSKVATHVVGDGLVTVNSAFGQHKDMDLDLPEQNKWLGRNINHNQLLENTEVYQVLKKWLEQ